jgi:hypothetical protein
MYSHATLIKISGETHREFSHHKHGGCYRIDATYPAACR